MAKDITIKNPQGTVIYYPKTVSDLVYDNENGKTVKKEIREVYPMLDNFNENLVEITPTKVEVGAYLRASSELHTEYTNFMAYYYEYESGKTYKCTNVCAGRSTAVVFYVDENNLQIGYEFPITTTDAISLYEEEINPIFGTTYIVLQVSDLNYIPKLYYEELTLKPISGDTIINGAITNNKIANSTITKDKLAFSIKDKVNVDFIRYNNIFEYDGLIESGGTNVMPNGNGDSITPKVSRSSDYDNPFGLKYCTILSPIDALREGSYYAKPYRRFYITDILEDKTKFTLGYWLNTTKLSSQQIYITVNSQIYIGEIKNSESENTITKDETDYTAILKYKKYQYNNEDWAFVQLQVSSKLAETNSVGFTLNCLGGASNIGKEYPMCNFTLINDIVELDAYTYYPTKEDLLYSIQQDAVIADGSVTENKLSLAVQEKLNSSGGYTPTINGILAVCGDSITEGAGLINDPTATISIEDIYYPIDKTGSVGNTKTYGYYIAKANKMYGWYNYGKSGSTLGNVKADNSYKYGFSDTRYMNMAENLTHITIFFGWNDAAYGYKMLIEEWIESNYGTRKAWTNDSSKFDTLCNGTLYYCSAEENTAVKAVSGTINGNSYSGVSYFQHSYIGTTNDATNKTWWGAFNIVLPYLKNKYPLAKILVITGYGATGEMADAAIAAAKKWNVPYLDLSAPETHFLQSRNSSEYQGTIYWDASKFSDTTKWNHSYPSGDISSSEWNIRVYTYDHTHPNLYGYEFLYPIIMNKLNSI